MYGKIKMKLHWVFIVTILLWVTLCTGQSNNQSPESPSCKNYNGDNVDWFIIYKLPGSYDEYALTSSSSSEWRLSPSAINTKESSLARTLSPLYSKSSRPSTLTIEYNDQLPNENCNSQFAHSKGVLSIDSEKGFWLLHSIPKYPLFTSGLPTYPSTGYKNGQVAICVNFNSGEYLNILNNLLVFKPNLYEDLVLTDEQQQILQSALVNATLFSQYISTPNPWPYGISNSFQFTSSGRGTGFSVISKHASHQVDIYSMALTDLYPRPESIYVQSWRPNLVGTDPRQIIDLDEINFPEGAWRRSMDHSKWAVGSNTNVVCIGDLNRTKSKSLYNATITASVERGGGLLCIHHASVTSHFRFLVGLAPPTESDSEEDMCNDDG